MEDAQLRSATLGYALALCRAIAACRQLEQALGLLAQGANALLDIPELGDSSVDAADAVDEELASCRHSLAVAAAAAAAAAGSELHSAGQLLQHVFYSSPAFQEVSEVLLTVVAPDWVSRFSPAQRQRLFDPWFYQAPAAALLTAVVSHLSTVQPSSLPARSGHARVTAVSAEEAACLLAARFSAPGSSGVADLLQHVASKAAAAAASPAGMAVATAAERAAAEPAGPTAAQKEEEELAAALASVPERAAPVELPALSAEAFVPAVTNSLLLQLAALTAAGGTAAQQRAAQPAAMPPAAAAATAFVADVLSRFSRRGHAAAAAAALVSVQRQGAGGSALASSVLAAVPDAAGLEKLLEGAVKVAATQAAGLAGSASSSQPMPLPLDACPQDDPAACACAAMLAALLQPAVWRSRADARLLLTDKLLVQQQRRLLPLPALRGLLLFLSQQGGDSDESASASSGSGSGDAVLADAAASVAQLWGDASAVQRLSAPHQAYLTAALCGCLALLSRQQLDAHLRLLPLLLAGITTRLDSPLASVRRQGMRVGQSLSRLLDPSKPPMFAEEHGQLQKLLPEEHWEGGQAQQAQQAEQQRRQGAAAAAPPGKARGTSGGGSAAQRRREQREQRRQEREQRRARRRSKEGMEGEEGPLTETDSDDAAGGWGSDASSISSSGSEGSASSGGMEAFDLEESDEEDPARSKLQLRDLPKLLLSGAEQDWRGQLRALRHAEYLIRAAPDELAQYAVSLARALIHAKVPGWMDEEMPPPAQGGPALSANTQRFRDVVSLLVGAPEPAGLALAAELYGPSMDVYQRAMIMDGMAAAAAEMAKPGASLPPLPGLHPQPAPTWQLGGPATQAVAAAAAAAAAGLTPEQQRLLTTTADGSKRLGRVTRIASRSLAARQRGGAGAAPAGHVNRFPPIALKWAAALLRHCDEPQHGIDLLGRDSFLLGKLLVTLGAFLEASAQSAEAATLAAATLELMRCGRVHNHPEPYVRRAALLTAGQVLAAVPPARLATAMLGAAAGGGGGGGLSAAAAARDATDDALVTRLEWLRKWTEGMAAGDTDDSCRMMADGVRKLQASLAAGALAALTGGQQAGPLEGGGLLPLPTGASGSGRLGPGLLAGGLGLPDIRLP
ncbi:hypothetical protein ABPG75_013778 [Micractinium tetrahymenae]